MKIEPLTAPDLAVLLILIAICLLSGIETTVF